MRPTKLSIIAFAIFSLCPLRKTFAQAPRPDDVKVFMHDAGWCWYQDPRAIIHDKKLILGGVSGQTGDVKIAVYDLENSKSLGVVTLAAKFEVDDHDVPALYVRPDGRLLAVWSKHSNQKIHHYAISAPDDFLQWGDPERFVHDYDERGGVCYQNLYFSKSQGLLYNFFRDGRTYNPTFITSTDYGDTWGNRTHFIADEVDGRQRPYPRYLQRDADTIGVSFTEGHPRNFGNSLYYAEYRDGSFFRVDGQKIKDIKEGPLTPKEAERIYNGSDTITKADGFGSVPNSAWTCAVAVDSNRHPVLGYTVYHSNSDHRFRIASWDGSRWIDREIAYAGTCLYDRESSYTGLLTFDPTDPNHVFISTDVDPMTGRESLGKHQLFSASIDRNDSVSSIRWERITDDRKVRNIRPMAVSGDGFHVLLWLRGPWRTYTDYQSDIVGKVLVKP